jgi:hypothetical protein
MVAAFTDRSSEKSRATYYQYLPQIIQNLVDDELDSITRDDESRFSPILDSPEMLTKA